MTRTLIQCAFYPTEVQMFANLEWHLNNIATHFYSLPPKEADFGTRAVFSCR